MNGLIQDIRYALRQLRKNPGFTFVAIVTLALGIGANTAIFELLDAIRLRSLPIPNPHELVEIRIIGGNKGFGVNNGEYAQLTRPVWQEIRQHHEPFSGVFAWDVQQQRIGKGSESRPVRALEVSGDFFQVLGIQPWRGRLLAASDEQEASCTTSRVVVSYPYWKSQMSGRDLTGTETLVIDGHPAEVIGVTSPAFFGLAVGEGFDIAFPFCHPMEVRREMFDISVMGRLRPEWTLERASAQLGAMSPGIFEATAPAGYSAKAIQRFKDYRLAAYPASEGVSWLRAIYESSLNLLLAITGLVLLIACANLANLLMARAAARGREVAVRLALGASRIRLLRQPLVESALLAAIGTCLGIILAQLLSRILVWSLSSMDNPAELAIGTDWRVLLFATSVAVLTCLIFGVAPALRWAHAEPVSAMKSGGRWMTGGKEKFSIQRSMVVAQISVSLILLAGALLFVRSFRSLMTIDPGMRESGITIAFLGFNDSHVRPDHYENFKRELLDQIRSVPGVINAAITTNAPLLGGSWTHNINTAATEGWSKFTWVSPDYFETMGIPLQAGRAFSENDTNSSPRVAIVNHAFIQKFFGATSPIGQTLRTSPEPNYPSTVYQIVGVIPDTKYNDIRGDILPMAFAPASQYPAQAQGPWTTVMIYSNTSPELAIKRQIAALHPEIVTNFSDFQAEILDGLRRERLLAMVSGFFGILAGLLAMVGLYGVISYTVVQRRNEIGIRVALGAARRRIVFMVMREAGILLVIGVVIGTLLSLVAGRGISSLLFGVKPDDLFTLVISILLLGVISGLASFFPARRAARVDPMVALRYE